MKRHKTWNSFGVLCWLFLFVLAGCGKISIIQDLAESEANEILVALADKGIDADKVKEEKSQKVSWSVEVAPKDQAQARKVLVDNNLPRRRELGFAGICKEKGLIPTPEEEKCRKILALKGEIINSLSRVPGVIESDVVLNIPDVSEFASETQPNKRPTASAVIRVKKTPEGMDLTESKIQRFISNTVENLDPRDVSVVISYVQPVEELLKQNPVSGKKLAAIAGLKMDPDSKGKFKIYALSVLLLLVAISVALVFSLLKLTKLRQSLKGSPPAGMSVAVPGAEQDPNRMIQGAEGAPGAMPQIPAAGQTVQKT